MIDCWSRRARRLFGGDHLSAQARRFLLVGVLNTGFGYAVFSLATVLGAHALLALIIANLAGVAFNFQTSRRLVFRRSDPGSALRFAALYGGLLMINWGAIRALERLGAPALAAQAVLLLPMAGLSFLGQRLLIFRPATAPGPGAGEGAGLGPSKLFWRPAPGREVVGPLAVIVAVLAAGNAVFLVGMLAGVWLSICTCALAGLSIWLLFGRGAGFSPASQRADRRRLWAAAGLLALTLCLLGGEGRLFYANTDWQIRDAVLADLSQRPWPVSYITSEGAHLVLRAPLGMFMLPSLAGRLLGWRAAGPALLVQNTLLLSAVLAMFMGAARRWRERLLIAAVFVAFSGLDLFGELLVGHFVYQPGSEGMVPSLEPWSSGLQYSSLVTDLFWAPNHALPALAMAATYLAWRRGQASSLMLAGVTGLSMLWSPLAVMGAAPFAILAGLDDLRTRRIGWLAPVVLAPLVAGLLPVAAYLTLKGGAVVHGLNFGSNAFQFYGLFAVLEIFPLLYLASRAAAQDRSARVDLGVCAVLLLLMPMYFIGGSNDFMMRASILPLALLAMMAARGLIQDLGARRTRRVAVSLVILVLGAFTPAFEIARAVLQPVDPPQPTDLLTAWEAPASRDTSQATYTTSAQDFARDALLFKQPAAPRAN